MGRLGDHPNIVTIHDMGEHEGQPYIVLPVMAGGDVEGLIEKAAERRLLLEQAVDIGKCVCRGLDFAINEFREMKMQPSLKRALRQKKILKA